MEQHGQGHFGWRLAARAIVLGLVLVLIALAGGELWSGHCDADCENQCSDTCEGCGDCIHCLPTLHMLVVVSSKMSSCELMPAGNVFGVSLSFDGAAGGGIDHPPQNIC
jgi:hypothetical protein